MTENRYFCGRCIYTDTLAAPTYKGGADSRIVSIVGAKAYQEGSADSVSGITTPDDKTVVVELEEANAAFIGNMYTCILPKHILGDVDPGTWDTDDFNRHPIGTGKYKFVEWKSGQYIELRRTRTTSVQSQALTVSM